MSLFANVEAKLKEFLLQDIPKEVKVLIDEIEFEMKRLEARIAALETASKRPAQTAQVPGMAKMPISAELATNTPAVKA